MPAGQTEGDIGYDERDDFYDTEYDSASGQLSTPLLCAVGTRLSINLVKCTRNL